MSTPLFFKDHPMFAPRPEDVERHRDILQVRNAQMVLALRAVLDWLNGEPIMRGKDKCIAPHGWDVIRKIVEGALK